ncbi:MAG: hypothetical protein ACK41O_16195 [Runella zeae]
MTQWITVESGELLINVEERPQSDGFPRMEWTILGGVMINNNLSMGWVKSGSGSREMDIKKNNVFASKIDVESYLVFWGTLETFITDPNHTINDEKAI